jgi:hypothetical protein
LYRRRFSFYYLLDFEGPPKAKRLKGEAKNAKGIGRKTFSYVKTGLIFLSI